jgi:hypothetical protein
MLTNYFIRESAQPLLQCYKSSGLIVLVEKIPQKAEGHTVISTQQRMIDRVLAISFSDVPLCSTLMQIPIPPRIGRFKSMRENLLKETLVSHPRARFTLGHQEKSVPSKAIDEIGRVIPASDCIGQRNAETPQNSRIQQKFTNPRVEVFPDITQQVISYFLAPL